MTEPSNKREPSAADEFQQAGQQEPLNLVQEFLLFVRENKKWWLIPILLVFGLVSLVTTPVPEEKRRAFAAAIDS